MQAGLRASAYRHRGRHLRLITIVTTLVLVDLWLWTRLGLNLVTTGQGASGEVLIAILVATASLLAMIAVWRNPLSWNAAALATPATRHALATHHAGHIVAMHLQDPSRANRANVLDPCLLARAEVPPTSQTALRAELNIALAGASAEEIFAGESGSHVAADLATATAIGASMVGRFGMTGSLVSLATSRVNTAKFTEKVLADVRTRKELESLLRDSKRDSMRMLLENRHLIIALRDALMRSHSLSASQIHRVIGDAEERRHTDGEVLVDLRAATERTRPVVSVSEL
jgi:hypothetical protein